MMCRRQQHMGGINDSRGDQRVDAGEGSADPAARREPLRPLDVDVDDGGDLGSRQIAERRGMDISDVSGADEADASQGAVLLCAVIRWRWLLRVRMSRNKASCP